jgi:hypothetical protein
MLDCLPLALPEKLSLIKYTMGSLFYGGHFSKHEMADFFEKKKKRKETIFLRAKGFMILWESKIASTPAGAGNDLMTFY